LVGLIAGSVVLLIYVFTGVPIEAISRVVKRLQNDESIGFQGYFVLFVFGGFLLIQFILFLGVLSWTLRGGWKSVLSGIRELYSDFLR
jgi:hypothetical protein